MFKPTKTGQAERTGHMALIINEVFFGPAADLTGDANGDGTREASGDEFIEIVNTGPGSVDISGFTLSDDDGGNPFTFPASTILAENQAAVLFGGGTPTGSFGGALVFTDDGTIGTGLGNGGDLIELRDASAMLVDAIGYGNAGAVSGDSDQSVTRDPDLTGDFADHSAATGSNGALFSPGTRIDGSAFLSEFNLQISEIWPGQEGTDVTADWFEIVNNGTVAWVSGVDPDLYYDDASADADAADLIEGLTQIDPGERAIVVIGDAGDGATFTTVWGAVADLSGVEIGFTDGAALGQDGDTVNLFLGDPTVAVDITDAETYPDTSANSGQSFDVELGQFSTVGNASNAVATGVTGGSSGDEPAIGSPGNAEPLITAAGVLDVTAIGGFTSTAGAEIVAFDPDTDLAFVTAGTGVEVLDLSDPDTPTLVTTLMPAEDTGFQEIVGGSVNSVAVANGALAVAVSGAVETDPGVVVFYNIATLEPAIGALVGALPDSVAASPDGSYVVVANEGEANDEDNDPSVLPNPNGSVSIIEIVDTVVIANPTTFDFTHSSITFDALEAKGVRVDRSAPSAAADLEPEFVSIVGTTAFVTLQENNAVAVIDDITSFTGFTIDDIIGLGTVDHALEGNEIDPSDEDDAIDLRTVPVQGLRMPDGIASYTVGGETYFVTANEGDARVDDDRIGDITLDATAFPTAATLQMDEELGRLQVSIINGDTEPDGDFDELFAFGSRSFSIFDADGSLVFDSGSDLDRIQAGLGTYDDGRSDNKGSEPESVEIGEIDGRTYAFVALERSDDENGPGGVIAVYDITDPNDVTFDQAILSSGDFSPEGLDFVAAEDSPIERPLLLAAFEGTNTLEIFQLSDTPPKIFNETFDYAELGEPAAFTVTDTNGMASFFGEASSFDYFGVFDGNGDGGDDFGTDPQPTSTNTYTGFDDNVLIGSDIDGGSPAISEPAFLTWTGIDIAGLQFLQIMADLATDDSSGALDPTDFISFDVSIDGGEFFPVLAFETVDNSSFNQPSFLQDLNFDGVGEGTALTSSAQSFSGVFDVDGSTLDLRLAVRIDAGFEDIGIDNIMLFEPDAPIVSISALAVTEGDPGDNQSLTFTLTRSGNTETAFSVDVEFASQVADAADFVAGLPQTTTVDFAAGETEQTVSIAIAGDTEQEVSEDLVATLTNQTEGALIATAEATATIINDDGALITPISDIQGNPSEQITQFGRSDASRLFGEVVTIQAVVVGDHQSNGLGTDGDLRGFFVQEEASDEDGDALSSEGIFVFDGSTPGIDVTPGDLVQITGTVDEFFGETQIDTVTEIIVLASDQIGLVNEAVIEFPVGTTRTNADGELIADLEAYEGMLVTVPQELTVSDLFTLGRFGDLGLHADGRLEVFTQANEPSVAGFAEYQNLAVRNTLVLDDGSTEQNPAFIPFEIGAPDDGEVAGQLDANDQLRAGDTVSDLTGVLRFGRGSGGSGDEIYRVNPVETPDFVNENPRPEEAPDVPGALTVASFNLLNFFTSLDDGISFNDNPLTAGPTPLEPRGADDLTTNGATPAPNTQADDPLGEFNRQLDKLVAAVTELGADIFGLIELENEFPGFPDASNIDGQTAVERLIDELNDALPGVDYQFAAPSNGALSGDSGDAITVALIYDANAVEIADGTTVEVLNDALLGDLGVDPGVAVFDGQSTSRAPIAATFEELSTGETFTVAVNHFKSKGSPGTAPTGDVDIGDGVGNANQTRLNAAIALDAWLDTDPTGSGDGDLLIIGDLNAYAMEDPIQFLFDEGYEDQVVRFLEEGEVEYSFGFPLDLDTSPATQAFGALDYALATEAFSEQIVGAREWHINADEASVFDYNLEFRPQAQADGLFDATPFRASDHDPVVIGLGLGDLPVANPDIVQATIGEGAIFDVLANDLDPRNIRLAIESVEDPENGTATITEDNTILYTPDDGFSGVETFSYTLVDDGGRNSIGEIEVSLVSDGANPAPGEDPVGPVPVDPVEPDPVEPEPIVEVNRPPVARPDVFLGGVGELIEGNLLADNGFGRDFDPDFNRLRAVRINGEGGVIGEPVELPSGASLTLESNGAFTYDAGDAFGDVAAGETVADRFSYRISDGLGGRDFAFVDIELTAAEVVTGTSGDDRFEVSGFDTALEFDGGAGADTLEIIGIDFASVVARPNAGGFSFSQPGGAGGEGRSVSVTGVETILFADAAVAVSSDPEVVKLALVYDAAFDRLGEAAGLGFWAEVLEGGTGVGEIADIFAASDEFAALWGEDLSNEAYVAVVYENSLDREPDDGGLDFWTRQLDDGVLDRGDVLVAFACANETVVLTENETDDGVLTLLA